MRIAPLPISHKSPMVAPTASQIACRASVIEDCHSAAEGCAFCCSCRPVWSSTSPATDCRLNQQKIGNHQEAGQTPQTGKRTQVNLEETLGKIVELSREELHIVRKRGEEKTAARDHGHDFHEMQRAADRLDHYAHLLRKLHDSELGLHWRHESMHDTAHSS